MNHPDDMVHDDMTQAQTDKLYDHHRQQLSAMLDGELPPDQAKFMLRRLEHDGELAACWERWQVCGDILRGRHDALLPADFSGRVARAIAGDASIAPTAVATAVAAKHARWTRWGGGALAASVAMAALLLVRQSPQIDATDAQAPVQVAAATSSTAGLPATPALESPAKPVPAPQAPDTVADIAGAVAVADVPRRIADRRSRAQSHRAGLRLRQDNAPVAVAVNAPRAAVVANRAPTPLDITLKIAPEIAPAPVLATSTDPFAAHGVVASKPWPRAILPNFPASAGTFNASAPGDFHPFEPRVLSQPQPAEPDANADQGMSGPR